MTPDTPDETRLESLIAQAFERLPSPDPGRMAEIEARLTRRPAFVRQRTIAWLRYWWLVIALASAGAATATWWVLDYPLEEEPEPQMSVPLLAPPLEPLPETPPESRTAIEQTAPRPSEDPASAGERELGQKRGPIIYRRER